MFNSLRSKGKTLKPVPLIGLIDKHNINSLNFLAEIQYDLEAHSKNPEAQEPELMMPSLYAYRTAMAGLYVQGLLQKEDYDKADAIHYDMLFRMAHLLSSKDQVYFQEKSSDYAIDFIRTYCDSFDKRTAGLLVVAAKKGICLLEALWYALFDEIGDEEKCHEVCRVIVTPQFCMAFFNSGIWDHDNDDLEATIVKVNDFYKNKSGSFKKEVEVGTVITDSFAPKQEVHTQQGLMKYSKDISKLSYKDLCIEFSNVMAAKHNLMMIPRGLDDATGNQKIITDLVDKALMICVFKFGQERVLSFANNDLRRVNRLIDQCDQEIAANPVPPNEHGLCLFNKLEQYF